MGETWVAPVIAGFFGLAGIIAGAIFKIRTDRRTADSAKEPTVLEAWAEAEKQRRLRRAFEDLYYLVRGAFRGYARRMNEPHEPSAVELTDTERAALEAQPPKEA